MGRYFEVDPFQDHFTLIVAEADIVEADGPCHPIGQRNGIGFLLNVRRFIKDFGDPIGAGQRLLDFFPGIAEMVQRLVEEFQVEKKSHQVFDGQGLLQDEATAKVNNNNRAQGRGELDKGLKDGQQLEGV